MDNALQLNSRGFLSTKKRRSSAHEKIAAFYCFLYINGNFLGVFVNYADLIIHIICAVLFFISIFLIGSKLYDENLISLVAGVIFLLSFVLSNNLVLYNYFKSFIRCGIFSIYFFSQIKDYKAFIKYFGRMSIITFLIYCTSPYLSSNFYGLGSYMGFGFGVALPCYFGIVLYRLLYKKKLLIPFELFCFFEIVMFANRSCLLSIGLFWVFYLLLFVKGGGYKNFIILFSFAILLFFILFYNQIFISINEYITEKGIDNRPWQKLYEFYEQGDWNVLTSGREDIWTDAIKLIPKYFFFGMGIGGFESYYGMYVHNIFLDILLSFGILALIFFVIVFIYSLYCFYRIDNKVVKMLAVMLLSFWFIKLFFSGVFVYDQYFWLYFALLFKAKKYTKTIKDPLKRINDTIVRNDSWNI